MCLVLYMKGVSECAWTQKSRYKNKSYSACRELVSSNITYIQAQEKAELLPSGDTKYQFKILLPPFLPGTWRGSLGSITYYVSVVIEQPIHGSRLYTKDFFVPHVRDLQLEPQLRLESRVDVVRTFYNIFIPLGKIEVKVWTPISGVLAGQSIPILCEINNKSKVCVVNIMFVLTKIEVYRSDTPKTKYKYVRTDVCRLSRVIKISKGNHVSCSILVTPQYLEPTNTYYNNKICHVKYELWLSIQTSLPNKSAFGYPNIDTPYIPIVIGSAPLENWNDCDLQSEIKNLAQVVSTEKMIPVIWDPSDLSLCVKIKENQMTKLERRQTTIQFI